MSSSISMLESPLVAYTLSLDMSPAPATCRVQEPQISRLPPPDPARPFTETHEYTPCLSRLSTELLLLLIEQLRDIDYASLWNFRQVCSKFNTLATPTIYRKVTFNENLVHEGAELQYPNLLQNIAAYTQHVVIRSNLEPRGIRSVLWKIQHLSAIEWQFEDEELQTDGLWVPSDLLNSSSWGSEGPRLSIDNLPLMDFADGPNPYAQAIPSNLLVSLRLAYPTPPLTTRLSSLKCLLLQSPRLETLYYQDRGQGTLFQFSKGERMPPLRDLTLKSYDWSHDANEVQQHWDFSRLQSLELISMPIFNFLNSICYDDMKNLHTLHVEDWSIHVPDRKEEATYMLHTLIKDHIKELESLEITCFVENFAIDAILKHGLTLQRLKIRDHVGFGEENLLCPVLTIPNLALLGRGLNRLNYLELDINLSKYSADQLIQTICQFSKLDTLILHMQTALQHLDTDTVEFGTDPDYDSARSLFSLLIHYQSLMHPDRPWRNVTINVGGWKRVMVRRVSVRWRLLGQSGLHAERCFVLERKNGQYGVREEMAVEAWSRRVTPELEETDEEQEEEEEEEEGEEEEGEEEGGA